MTLPRPFDAERNFGLVRQVPAERPQLRGAPQRAVDEKSVHDGVEARRQIRVAADEVIRHGAAEPVAPALGIQPKYVVAVCVSFADPQFADDAAFGKNFAQLALLALVADEARLLASSPESKRASRIRNAHNREHHVGCRKNLARQRIEQHAYIPYTHGSCGVYDEFATANHQMLGEQIAGIQKVGRMVARCW
ncbi:MAG: hypothetical protein WBD71_19205 [Xanthobacteraceae bacterium]